MEDHELTGHSVFVTGADGLIGSWLIKELLTRGARVLALRRDEPAVSALDLLKLSGRVDVMRGDVCAPGLVARALAEYEVDSVFHLAAQTLVGVASRSPLSTFETNVRGTWVLLEACRSYGVERVVVASSDKAYGPALELPYREDHPLQPRYPYDVSKAAADLIARCYWPSFELPVAVTRFANVYGGADTNRSRLVPESICAALAGVAPRIRSDGSPERDFLYVEDAASAYIALWAALGRGEGRGEAFNGGSGRCWSVREVVSLICRLTDSAVEPAWGGPGSPPGEIDRQWVDATRLTEVTGWRPTVSLEDGLQRTIDWYRAHPAMWKGS